MKISEDNDRFLVRFEVGEKLPDALLELAKQWGWVSAQITGLGAVKGVTLAYYDLPEQKYITHPIEGIVELVSMVGNLAMFNGAPIWHMHCCVADMNGNLKGGHLVTLEVAVTVECWIHKSDKPVTRRYDEAAGLNLLDL
jgi:predicted DNA-binding protein with PD1-like motif